MESVRAPLVWRLLLASLLALVCAFPAGAALGTNFGPEGVASASSYYGPGYEIEKGNDGDLSTRWSGAERQQWYQIQWASPRTFNMVILRNLAADWNQNIPFTVQVWDSALGMFRDAQTITPATSVVTFRFADVTTTRVRATNVITFWEMEVYRDDGVPEPPEPEQQLTASTLLQPDGEFRLSLDGLWRFRYGTTPVTGFHLPAFDDAAWETFSVPSNWELTRPAKPDQPGYDQAIGLYRRWIDVPASWTGSRVLLYCRGINNSAEVWVNGARIGYHESGYTSFQMDATSAILPGQSNLLAIRVSKQSESSDLDIGGYWHLGGIYRSLALVAVPQDRVDDYRIRTTLADSGSCDVRIDCAVSLAGGDSSGYAVRAILRDAQRGMFAGTVAQVSDGQASLSFSVADPHLWSAEDPYLHTLQLSLLTPGGQTVHQFTDRVGLREVSISNATLLVNGRPIWIHGFNRHETHATLGRALNTDVWRQDLELMKACNVNTVRTSHYNADPEFIRLCDEYGMYVIDEIPFCWASGKGLDDPSREKHFVRRARETLARDSNRPSVIIWSLGNENSGFGVNMQSVIDFVAAADPTRPKLSPALPVEVFGHAYHGLDIDSVHYPTLDGVLGLGMSPDRKKYPLVMTECTGVFSWVPDGLKWDPNQHDYWAEGEKNYLDVVHRYGPSIAGGCIWAWVDEAIANSWDPGGGVLYPDASYGGWGPWGIVDAWRNLKPEYWNMKKIYSPIRVQQTSASVELGSHPRIPVRSFYSFTNLDQVQVGWQIANATGPLASGSATCPLEPNTSGELQIPWTPEQVGDYRITLTFTDPAARQVDTETIALSVVTGLSLSLGLAPRISHSGSIGVSAHVGASSPCSGILHIAASAGANTFWAEQIPVQLPGSATDTVVARSFDPGDVSGEIVVTAALTAAGRVQSASSTCYRTSDDIRQSVAVRNPDASSPAIIDVEFSNPGGNWRVIDLHSGDTVELTPSDGRLVGGVEVPPASERVLALVRSVGPRMPGLRTSVQGGQFSVGGVGWECRFDTATGRLLSLADGSAAISRAPELYLGEETPGKNGLTTEWTLINGLPAMNGVLIPHWQGSPRISVGPDCVIVRTHATYDLQTPQSTNPIAQAEWTYRVYSQGVVRVAADLAYSGPRQHAWELGVRMGLDKALNTYSWCRKALWTSYPDDHIGRAEGTVPNDSYTASGTRIDALEASFARPDGSGICFYPLSGTFHTRCRTLPADTEFFVAQKVSPLADVGAMLMPERIIVLDAGYTATLGFNVSLRRGAAGGAPVVVSGAANSVPVPTQGFLDWQPPVLNAASGAIVCLGQDPVLEDLAGLPFQVVNAFANDQALEQIVQACSNSASWLVLAGGALMKQAGYDPEELFGSPGFAAFIESFLANDGTIVLLDSPEARNGAQYLPHWLPALSDRQYPVSFTAGPYQPYDRSMLSLSGVGDTTWPNGLDTWYGTHMVFSLSRSPRVEGDLTLKALDWDHNGRIQDLIVGGQVVYRLQNFDTQPVYYTARFDESNRDFDNSITCSLVQGPNAVIMGLSFTGGYAATWPDFQNSDFEYLEAFFENGRMVRCSPEHLFSRLTDLVAPAGPELTYVTTAVPLASGGQYWISASGTYSFNSNAAWAADAEFWTSDGWASASEQWPLNGPSAANALDLHMIDQSVGGTGTAAEWQGRQADGSYAAHKFSPTHEYRYTYTGTGAPLTFFLSDIVPYGSPYYADNTGAIRVTITVPHESKAIQPEPPAIICDRPEGWYPAPQQFTFTALGGFGPATAAYYRYAWDTSPGHAAWSGSEPVWSAGDLVVINGAGAWFLHVRAFDAAGAPGGAVDLGPYGTDPTPPALPVVTDDGLLTASSTLHCLWSASDPESGVAGHSYAIGQTPTDTGSYVQGWKDAGAEAEVTCANLPLVEGGQYFFYVRARNAAGLWSASGCSDGIRYVIAVQVGTPAEARALPDEAYVEITAPLVVSAVWPGVLAAQAADRSSGISVEDVAAGHMPGDMVSVLGRLAIRHGERVLLDAQLSPVSHASAPRALGLAFRSVDWGLETGGLFVRVWGRVASIDSQAQPAWFDIDSGSGMPLRIGLRGGLAAPEAGTYVAVDGVSGMWNEARRCVWAAHSPIVLVD